MSDPQPIPVSDLFHACDDSDLDIATSADLDPISGIVGQERATKAIDYAVAMDIDGYNIFVLGPPGTGRRTFVERVLTAAAVKKPTATDWCYVNNFDEPQRPMAIELPAGMAKRFAGHMEEFIDEVHSTLSAAFDGDDYRARRQAIEAEFQSEQAASLESVHKDAREHDIRIMQTPSGMIFAPVRDGEALGPNEFEKLPENEQKTIQEDVERLSKKLQKAMEGTPQRIRKMREKIVELDNQITTFSVGSLIKDLIKAYDKFPRIVEFLESVEQDLVKNSASMRHESEGEMSLMQLMSDGRSTRRYAINVIVSREPYGPAPVVIEDRPAYSHLIGRVEHRAQMGTLTTDFDLIRAGSLHEANGGYLILDARHLLIEPFAWEGLKRAIKSKTIKIESMAEAYSLTSTTALEPEPIPLNVKIVLIGDRRLYFLLQAADPEFADLFKVAADFDDRMERTKATQHEFARMVAAIAERNGLLPLARGAIYRAIEEAAREAGDQERLSAEIRRTEDLIREAHYCASTDGRNEIISADIDSALENREDRNGRIRDRIMEEITRNTILIDTSGTRVGQINGLAVYQLGDYSFARPSRITVRVSLGSGKVIDIERESELGGALHSKGVLILSGFIAANYLIDKPLSLSATIAFEQSYGGVDGDSASCAELFALLSAIADVPLAQNFAVTGSLNQFGDVQAIGGVNQKIEGFFDICQTRGLTGDQGVIIPAANVKHLMLRSRVLEAVEAGKFRIFAISHVDEGLSILSGISAGKRDDKGRFPAKTMNGRVCEALDALATKRKAFSKNQDKAADKRSKKSRKT